ncbi:MAG: type II toxin-antitoxin system HicB family antitoxin [Lachnospiraceae bacterium]|nr:type II toxin-antitoxin system HicB family antitoxin [Lachnospiraceae bacterium]
MQKYVYPAIFTPEEGGKFSVDFPDLEGCYTCGDDLAHAIYMAEDVLAMVLYEHERDGSPIPAPSDVKKLKVPAGSFSNLIMCDTLWYHKKHNASSVKKTLSIPAYLNDAATAAGINFSQVLQDALKEMLHLA